MPGPDHPITVTPHGKRVRVRFNGHVVADTTRALALREASYPVVFYIPREDADISAYLPSAHRTHCPYKGDATYHSLRVGEREAGDAVWSYEQPYPAVAAIAGYLAFYPSRIDEIVEG